MFFSSSMQTELNSCNVNTDQNNYDRDFFPIMEQPYTPGYIVLHKSLKIFLMDHFNTQI